MNFSAAQTPSVVTGGSKAFAMVRRQVYAEPQGPVHGDLPVAEGLVLEDLRLLVVLEVEEGVADPRPIVRSSCCRDSCVAV